MPTAITHYILTRKNEASVQVDIYDATSYASRQVYVDNALVKETTATSFSAPVKKNQKVDILGLSSGEAAQDFSSTLSDANGDKVRIDLPTSFLNADMKVYWDRGDGVVDYGRPIATVKATDVVSETVDGLGDLTLQDLGDLTLQQLGDLPINDTGQDFIRLDTTDRLQDGDYKFALVNYNAADNYHAPAVVSKTIVTRPDELEPYFVTYDPATDELIVSAGVDETIGTYKVYAAPWGGGKDAIDFANPILVGTSSPLVLTGIRGSHTSGTRYLCIRKSATSVEEKNFNILAFTALNGDWEGNYPAAPFKLTAMILPDNAVRLTFEYLATGAVTEGFKVYRGTSSVDYSNVVKTVPYQGDGIVVTDLPPIFVVTEIGVRAYRGGNVEGNVETVSIAPLTAPELVTGTGTVVWIDQ